MIGGTGLISTVTTRLLAERGAELTLYNRSNSAGPLPPGVRAVTGDRTDHARFEEQVAGLGRFDCVIDMVGYFPEDAESLVRAFGGRLEHLLFCSTVDVYRKPTWGYPIAPDAPRGGLNDYARRKTQQEDTLLAAHGRGDFAVTILRPAFTYGEGRGMVHSLGSANTYLDRLRRGKPIIVHGDGSSFWTACHRDDVGRGFADAAGNPNTYGQAYNVAGEEWLTWNQYHQTVARALGPEPTLIHIPTDLLVRLAPERAGICGDNFQFNNIFEQSASHEDFGFSYTIPLEKGVRRIAAWLEAHGGLPDSDADPEEDRLVAAWEKAAGSLQRNLTGRAA